MIRGVGMTRLQRLFSRTLLNVAAALFDLYVRGREPKGDGSDIGPRNPHIYDNASGF
jgi:hypothetical protein